MVLSTAHILLSSCVFAASARPPHTHQRGTYVVESDSEQAGAHGACRARGSARPDGPLSFFRKDTSLFKVVFLGMVRTHSGHSVGALERF